MTPAAFLLLMLWTPGSRCHADVQELMGTVGGLVTVTGGYEPGAYRNYLSSLCRQTTEEICDDVLDSKGTTSWSYRGRARMVSEHPSAGPVRVTITALRDWDTGLYCWRVWTGKEYEVLKRILLQVVIGLDPENGPRVLHQAESGSVTMECLYDQAHRWSKVWCKQREEDNCDWIGHSDGATSPEYTQRTSVSYNPQVGRMLLTLRELKLWDTGAYRCQELGGSTVLWKILLVVSNRDISVKANTSVKNLLQTDASAAPFGTPPSSTGHPRPVIRPRRPTAAATENLRTAATPTQGRIVTPGERFNNSSTRTTLPSDTEIAYLVWGVLRWILFLVLMTCAVTVSCLDRISNIFAGVKKHDSVRQGPL